MDPLARRGGHRVVHVRDEYGDGVSDEVWMDRLGRDRDAAFLTLDANIRKRRLEVAALKSRDLVGFWLLSKTWKRRARYDAFHELAGRLVLRWPDIVQATELSTRQAYEIPAGGGQLRGLTLP